MGLTLGLTLTGCATHRQAAADETSAAVQDAVGLPRERPGRIRIDDGDDTVPTPYGGDGARRRCSTVARDVARLTAVLGPDIEEEVRQREEEEVRREDQNWRDQGMDLARRTPGAAADAGRDFYRSSIVGLNPVRPVIRFIGGAGEIEREAREEVVMAQRRRAYLRGLYDGFGCPPAQMRRAFEAYGLIEESEEGAE